MTITYVRIFVISDERQNVKNLRLNLLINSLIQIFFIQYFWKNLK